MPIPIVLAFAAASVVIGGGVGTTLGGVVWLKNVIGRAAAERETAESERIKDVLRQKMSEQEVRVEAAAVGVDVDAAVAGYRAEQEGLVDLAKVVHDVVTGSAAVPVSSPDGGMRLASTTKLAVTSERATTPAQIRKWARQNGHPVADVGRIPISVLEAYRAAHPPAR